MMYLVTLLLWMVIGFITICITGAIHFYLAERKGYKCVEYWYERRIGSEHFNSYIRDCDLPIWLGCVLGLLIWPIKLYQTINEFDYYYEQYEKK